MSDETKDIAARCLEDPAFARQILEGDDYPQVRGAIIADLEDNRSVKGYLNPQPMPPAPELRFAISAWAEQAQVWNNWTALPRDNLSALTTIQ